MHHTKQLPTFGAEMLRCLRKIILYDYYIKTKGRPVNKTRWNNIWRCFNFICRTIPPPSPNGIKRNLLSRFYTGNFHVRSAHPTIGIAVKHFLNRLPVTTFLTALKREQHACGTVNYVMNFSDRCAQARCTSQRNSFRGCRWFHPCRFYPI